MGFCFVLFCFVFVFYFWDLADNYYDLKDQSNQFLKKLWYWGCKEISETWSGQGPFCKSTSAPYCKNFKENIRKSSDHFTDHAIWYIGFIMILKGLLSKENYNLDRFESV